MTEVAIPAEATEIPVLEAEAPRSLTVGEQLRAAREAKGLKLDDLAQSMKLGVRQLEALESGDWQALPGATFVRGFVRNYARLVGLDAQPMMEQLDAVLDRATPKLTLPESMPATMPGNGPVQRRDYAFAFGGLLFVLAALLVYLLAPTDLGAWRDGLVAMVAGEAKPVDPPAAVEPAATEPVLPPGATVQETLNPQSVVATETVPVADAAAEPAPVVATDASKPASAGLLVRVKKESWVEVRDRNGNVLLSQRVPDGADRQVEGNGPFAVVLGNAPGVSLTFRGKDVDLAPHTKGDVARLTLE